MRSIGFHASKGFIRFVVLDGERQSPVYVKHEKRPLELIDERPQYIQKARNLFSSVISTYQPDRLAYVLTMNAKSQAQLAGLLLPFGALNLCAADAGKPCREFITPNFSKSFFAKDSITFTDWKTACNTLIGAHPPNWTDAERQASLAALGAL